MARPLRIEYSGAFYHITSRGNERKEVFKSQRDREKFLFYLGSATERYGAIVHVYCLMDNHYHLLMETPAGNLSQIMHHVNGAYSTYFNTKRERSGHLFQVMDPGYENPLAELSHSVILCSSQFVAEIRDRFLKHKAPDRDLPGVRALLKKPSVEQIEKAVDLVLSSEAKLARQVKLNLCHRYSGLKLREIGLQFGVGQSAITQASRRIKLKAGTDRKLRKTVNRIEKMINM